MRYRRKLVTSFWLVMAHVLLTGAGIQQSLVAQTLKTPAAAELEEQTTSQKIDTILNTHFPDDKPGATVIVLQAGEPIYHSARGMAQLELQVPMERDMVLRIGSMTKQFTAAAIMILAEEGKLSVADNITRFLPEYPVQDAKITIEQLLTHTSGIRSYTSMPGWMRTKIVNPMTVNQIIDGFKNEPMDFQPGEKFRYNNSGYILLGAIIEQASGMSYEDFIQHRIFDPLEMTQSYYGKHQIIIHNRVSGYAGKIESPRNAKYLNMSQPYAAGSLLSTVGDLGKWNTALFSGKVVTHQSLKQMIKNHQLSDGSFAGYGYGLKPSRIQGSQAIAHGGGIFGFVSHGAYFPKEDIYIAVLCNSTAHRPNRAASQIAAVVLGGSKDKETTN